MLNKFASCILDIREAYLVKRRSFPDSDISRFANDEDELFKPPVNGIQIVQDRQTIQRLFCLVSLHHSRTEENRSDSWAPFRGRSPGYGEWPR